MVLALCLGAFFPADVSIREENLVVILFVGYCLSALYLLVSDSPWKN